MVLVYGVSKGWTRGAFKSCQIVRFVFSKSTLYDDKSVWKFVATHPVKKNDITVIGAHNSSSMFSNCICTLLSNHTGR